MNKLKMHSPNLTQDNIAHIRELFPGCVTEAEGEGGSVRLAVDFDQLRQELADSVVEGPQERYHLNWPGKREALLTANAPIAKTLRPRRTESVDFDATKNLFIEGDIHVLETQLALDLTSEQTLETLAGMFDVKRVPLSLLGKIGEFREFHRADFPAVQATVAPGTKLEDFDFYFDFVLALVARLEPLWNK